MMMPISNEDPPGWYPDQEMSDKEYLAYVTAMQELLEPPPAPTRTSPFRSYLFLIVMMIMVVVVLGIFTSQQQRSLPPAILGKLPPVSTQPRVSVSYDFAGSTTDASLVFATPTKAERHDVSLRSADVGGLPPLRFSFERGEFVYFRAHNIHEAGSISCEIRVNGDIISANTSYEPYGTARCEGKIPQR